MNFISLSGNNIFNILHGKVSNNADAQLQLYVKKRRPEMDHLHEADLDIHDINYYSDWSYDIRWYCQHNKCNLYRFHEVKLFLENYEKTVKRIATGIISQKVWNAITSRYIDNRDVSVLNQCVTYV